MNERIKELISMLGIEFCECRIPETGYEYMATEVEPQDLEKFAELIIKECIELANETRITYETARTETYDFGLKNRLHSGENASQLIMLNIRERFGVE